MRLNLENRMMVNQIVDRQHVGQSTAHVILSVIGRMQGGMTTFRSLPLDLRGALVRQVVQRHRANRDMYISVMGGQGRWQQA